jgi:hypothetical protein
MPRGFAGSGAFAIGSLALADQRLLVGIPRNFNRGGEAFLYRLNVFE